MKLIIYMRILLFVFVMLIFVVGVVWSIRDCGCFVRCLRRNMREFWCFRFGLSIRVRLWGKVKYRCFVV